MSQKRIQKILNLLSLSTPKQRIFTWVILSTVIFASPFHWLTNLSVYKRFGLEFAPSIGLTRSYWLLLHGDFEDAYRMNPLIVAVIGLGALILIKDMMRLLQPYLVIKQARPPS